MNRSAGTQSIDETRLIQQARAGDTEAFGVLVTAYQRFVYTFALRALSDPQEAQDAAQEAFLRAWLALPNFRGESRFSTWLFRITANLCFNRRPRLRRDLAAISMDEHLDAGHDYLDGRATPLQHVEAQERKSFLHQQIEQLPASFRVMLTLRYQQELSYEEIAAVLNIPVGTVKTGLHRAKSQLKAALLRSEETKEETQQEEIEWNSIHMLQTNH